MRRFILLCFLLLSFLVFAHEAHQVPKPTSENVQTTEMIQAGRPTTWLQWIGSFHLILLHFPIALINMLAISELLLGLLKRPIFDFSSRFLIVSAAILTPLTSLLGLIYSFSAAYEGLMETFLFWHMWFGISTAIVTVIAAYIRERLGRTTAYLFCLILLLLMVNITGFFGGGMTFGPYQLLPPLL